MIQNLIETVGERALEQSRSVKIGTTYEELRANVGKAAILAALEAIREPSAAVIQAGLDAYYGAGEDANSDHEKCMREASIAMIDVLRAEIESAA
jgi:hypothetical protein